MSRWGKGQCVAAGRGITRPFSIATRPKESPLASPVFVDLSGIAPLTIFVGSAEALPDDALARTLAAGLADVSLRLEIWPKMIRAWPACHQALAQGRQAVASEAMVQRRGMKLDACPTVIDEPDS